MTKTKRGVVAGGIILASLALFLLIFLFIANRNTKNNTNGTSVTPNYALEVVSIETLEKESKSPQDFYNNLMLEVKRAVYNGDSNMAFTYYLKANSIAEIDPVQKKVGNYKAYRLAVTSNNSEMQQQFMTFLGGEEAVKKLEQSVIKIDEGASE